MTKSETGIIRIRSTHDAAETVRRLQTALTERKLTVFAVVQFSEDARLAGLVMPFTQLVIFGNPRAGTPVMVAAPSAALDLPLKALIAEDPDGSIWLSCNTPQYLQARHQIAPELTQNLSGVEALLRSVAQ